MSCADLAMGADATLTATLASIDCQVNGAVAAGYGRLFGPSGAFGLALTLVLTIFVALIALSLLTGRTRLTLSAMTPKVLAFGLVLTFATAWPAYQAVVYGLLAGGPDEIASAFLGARSGATQAFAGRLDNLFDAVVEVGRSVAALGKAPNLEIASGLIWASAILLMLATMGLLVVARVVLAVLLALGPVFMIFALFGGTRGLFEGWLRTAVAFALAPMLIVLGGSGVMTMLGPLIGAIAADPAGAVASLRPIISLFLGAVIYAGLVLTLMWTAVSLTRGWRLPQASGDRPGGARPQAETATPPAASQASDPAPPGVAGYAAPERVSGVVAAVLREEGRAGDRRTTIVNPVDSPSGGSTLAARAPRRAEGLGQSFRASSAPRALAGSIGP